MSEAKVVWNDDCCPACLRRGTMKEMLYMSPRGCLNHVKEPEDQNDSYLYSFCKTVGGLYYCDFCGTVRVIKGIQSE